MLEVHVAFVLEGHEVDVGVGHFEAEHRHSYLAAGEGGFDGTGHALGEEGHLGQFLVVDVKDIVSLFFRYHQGVAPVDGVDVEEREELVVFGYLVSGNFDVDYA